MSIELNNDQIIANYKLEHWWHSYTSDQVIEVSGAAGTGKALTNDTIIPTTQGKKRLDEVVVGDILFNANGFPTRVLGVYPQGKLDVYEVLFEDGRTVRCNDEHIWHVFTDKTGANDTTLKHIIELMDHGRHCYIPNCVGINGVEIDQEKYNVYEKTKEIMVVNATNLRCNITSIEEDDLYRYFPDDVDLMSYKDKLKIYTTVLDYSYRVTDKLYEKSVYAVEIGNEKLAKQILSIARSLGFYASIRDHEQVKSMYNQYIDFDEIEARNGTCLLALTLEKCEFIEIEKITKLDTQEEMTCLFVDDPAHLFLCGDYIVTHNTTLINYFIDRIGLRNDQCLFISYTGKAVTVMQKNGLPAKTIHSAIYDYVQKVERDEEGNIILDKRGKARKKGYFELKDHLPKRIKLIVIDEGSMVPEKIANDILSFGIPVVVLGDLNQLPPVMGNPFFLKNPEIILTQIMRQVEGNPIIWLANEVLAGHSLKQGVYGSSAVIKRNDLTDFQILNTDIILTGLNRTRYKLNNYYREQLKKIKQLEYPHLGEKVMCVKNNWDECIDGFYLTNGMTGYVEKIYRESYNKRTMKMDFRPDFMKKFYKNLEFNYYHMYAPPGDPEDELREKYMFMYDKFEYSYAISTHKSQGSGWNNVLFLYEDFMNTDDSNKKLLYTGITRAIEQLTVVMP